MKKLFAETLYRGQKVRRSGSDGYIYQSLLEDVVEKLRRKTVTLVGELAQDVASIAQLEINDGSSSTSTTFAGTGSYQEVSVSKAISATATSIQIRLKAITSNGNVWAKKLRFYEGASVAPYDHSSDDWSRFPRLLSMSFPKMVGFYPYQYEEKRYFSVFIDGPTNTTLSCRAMFSGKHCQFSATGVLTGVPAWTNMPTIPIIPSSNVLVSENDYGVSGVGGYLDNGTANKILGIVVMIGNNTTTRMRLNNVASSSIVSTTNPITWASGDIWWVKGDYEID